MKNPIRSTFNCSAFALVASMLSGVAIRSHADSFYTNNASASYNVSTYWNPNGVPASVNADCDNGAFLCEVLPTDPPWTVTDIRAGSVNGATGGFWQQGGTNSLGGWLRLGVGTNSSGTYSMSGGTLNVSGTSMYMRIGEIGTGTFNLTNGAVNHLGTTPNPVIIGNRDSAGGPGTFSGPLSTGTINQSGGTFTNNGEFWVGEGTLAAGATVGTYNLSGGIVAANSWLAVGRNGANGIINITGGSLIKSANNTLTLAGIGTAQTGTINISAGALTNLAATWIGETANGIINLSGSGKMSVASTSVGYNGGKGFLNISGGSYLGTILNVGGNQTAASTTSQGHVNQTGGTVTMTSGDNRIGGGFSATDGNEIGIYNMSGGSLSLAANFQVGAYGNGELNLSGTATAAMTGGFAVVGRYGNSFGVVDVSAGSFNFNVTGNKLIVGEQGVGTLNVRGGTVTDSSTAAAGALLIGGTENTAGTVGVVNLIAGMLGAASVGTGSSGSANVSSTFNFNGGTLQARGASTTYMTGLNNAYVWSGGAVIDSQANAITISQPLIIPTGNGVATIPIATAGAGYQTPPIVKIVGGGGTNATAIALTNGAGAVSSILITSPGVNYVTAPTVTLLGGGFTTAATIGTVTIGANSSTGGLTKNGSGTMTLAGANNFTGDLTLNGGLLNFVAANNLGVGTAITFNGGGLQYGNNNNLDISTRTLTFNSGGANIDTGTNTVTFANAVGNGGAGALTKNGTGTLNLNAANAFSGNVTINTGSVVINNSLALGTGAKTITVNNGTAGLVQLHLNGSGGAINLPANMAFLTSNQNAPGSLVNDSGNNIINGPITMTVGGGNTWLTVSSGTLQLNGNITPNTAGRTLVLDGAGAGTINGQILDGGFVPGLIKNGAGTWTLNAVNTYSNSTTINAGTLVLGASASIANSSVINIASNSVLNASAISGGLVLNNSIAQALGGSGTVIGAVTAASADILNPGGTGVAGTLAINGGLTMNGNVTNLFDLANVTTEGSGVNDEIVVTGDLNLSGINKILVTPSVGSLGNGRYKLVKYSGALTGGAANFTVAFSTVPPRVTVTVDDTVTNEIDLVIVANPSTLTWQGDGTLNKWDAGATANWTNNLGAADFFFTGDNVTLDDTSTNRIVSVVGPLAPGSIVVNGTGDYTLAGTGKLTAGTGLTKNNNGLLTVNTTNDYAGVTTITAGTLVAGNASALGSAAGGTIVTNGATLDVNNQNLGAEAVTVSGAGVGGNGAIVNSTGGVGGQLNALRSVTLAGDTTLGANGGRFDVRANPTANFTANGYALTKTGTNDIYLVGTGDTGLGDVTVNSGMLGFQDSATLGDPSKNLSVGSGAGLALWSLTSTNVLNKVTALNTAKVFNGSGNNVFAGPVTLSGANTIDAVTSSGLTLSGPVGGAGSLIKTNAGLLVLAGTNNYAGNSLITAGTVAVGNGGPGATLGAGSVTNSGALQFNRSDDYVLANNVIDPGASGTMLKVNSNKLTLQGINTYLATGQGVVQINGGTVQLDSAATLTSGGEFWIAQNASTGACIINGGTLVVSNWLAVGRNNTNALGSLTLNTGSIQKYGAGNIIVGSLGGNGTLTVNGGTLFDNASLSLSENANQGQGTFNLNGGLVQALSLGSSGGLSSIARFNSGTLQAINNTPTFIGGLSQALVQSGGAMIDDGGFTVGVNQALLNDVTSPGGGLTKKGSGTMVLSGSSTYTGNTVVSNGVLQLNQDAVLHLSFDQVSGNIVTNIGTGGSAMNGYIVGNGVTIVNGGRYGKALSFDGTGGGVFTNVVAISNNVVGNINGTGGNWTVGVWVNTTTPGAQYLFNGTTSYTWSSLETIFYATSASSTAGTNAGMVRFGGGFNRGTAGVTSGGWHFIVVSDTGGVTTQYVDGAVDSWLLNGISTTSTGGMWVIGGSPDTGDGTAHFNGLIDEVYMFNRGLSLAEVQALYNSNNNLNPVLPTNTPVTLAQASSRLTLNDVSQSIGSLNGVAGSSVNLGISDTLTVGNDNTSTTFPGIIAGAGGLTKVGSGTLTLSATNTYLANTFVRSGSLILDNGGVISNNAYSDVGVSTGDNATMTLQGSAAYTTTSDFNAGDIGNSIGTVNLSGSATLTANAMFIGSANATGSSASGTINQTNGAVKTLSSGDGAFVIAGRNAGTSAGTGVYNLNSGTLSVGNGGNAWIGAYGNGTLNVNGGNAVLSGFVSIGRFAGGVGSINITSGSVSQTNNTRFTLVGENGGGTLTVSGNGQFNVNGGSQLLLGNLVGTGSGTVNLDGGMITAPKVVKGAGTGIFNFNGGTLKANAASAAFMTGLTSANIENGGAVIDDSGFTITIGQALLNNGTGGLTKLGAGSLTLSNANTYIGNTTISNGTLVLVGAGSISNSPSIVIGANAALDVSGETPGFALDASQTLVSSAATGNVIGNVNLGGGSLVLNYTNGTPTLAVTNGSFVLNNNSITVSVLGTTLPAGNYKLIATNSGGTVTGSVSTSSLTLNGAGSIGGATTALRIVNGELYLVVNHPPVANNNTYNRSGLAAWKIKVSDLLTNATDVDGDTLTLDSLGTSTNGVSLAISGGYVQYANANLVDDQFSYTVTDGNGGTNNAMITLVAGSTGAVAGQISGIGFNGGTASMSFAGIPGYKYNVEVSTNLTTWNTIWTTNAPSNGVFQFDDSAAPQPTAYYRLMWNGN